MADKVIVSKSKLQTLGDAIRSKTGTTASLTLDAMASEISNISMGITPTGTLEITDTNLTDVTSYANAQVVDSNLIADNIKKDIAILGITGTYEGEGGSTNTLKKLLDNTKSCYYLFYKYQGISVEDLISYNDTENITNMGDMFANCNNLQTIPLLNTRKVTNMVSMFVGCTNLQTIPELNTSRVTNMAYMFQNCKNLQTIDLTSMDKCTSTSNTSYMCGSCYSLTKFIIRTMTKVPSLNTNSFTNCYHFTGTANATYNPSGLKDGRIYVPDNMVDSLKSATNWSKYAGIIVPLSTL